MAHTIMVFDFGANEEAAQQARQKIDRWKQGFRLGEKLTVKFEREETAAAADAEDAETEEETKPAKKGAAKKAPAKKVKEKENSGGRVRLHVRLGFSEHEKLTQQRWLDRIPGEEPFKSAKGETIRHGDPEFAKSAERFESLD